LRGFLDAYGFEANGSCGEGINASIHHLRDAMHEFEEKGMKSKYHAMKDVLLALREIPMALYSCQMATTAVLMIAQIVEDVIHPRFFTLHNLLTLFLNGTEEYRELSAAAAAWKADQCLDAGRHLGEALQMILSEPSYPGVVAKHSAGQCGKKGAIADFLEERQPVVYYEYLADVSNGPAKLVEVSVQIAAGVADGFLLGLDGDACLRKGGGLGTQVFHLIKALGSGNDLGAVRALVQGLEDAYPLYKACKGEKGRLKTLLKTLAILRHPRELVYAVGHSFKVNAVDVTLEVATAVLAAQGKDWHRVGMELGKMLARIAETLAPVNYTVGDFSQWISVESSANTVVV